MNTNEITYNELSAGDLLNNYGQIDITGYTDYLDDEEVCFKLVVWDLQCKYASAVHEYGKKLIFGIQCSFNNLLEFMWGLQVLNAYNPKDISGDTTDYNVITYTEIKKIIQKLYTL